MLDTENKRNEFFIYSLGGRKSGYPKAKELLEKNVYKWRKSWRI